jgi:hypothetical protein
MTEESAK